MRAERNKYEATINGEPYEPDEKPPVSIWLTRTILNFVMSFLAIVPMMIHIYLNIPFTYEMNDDSALCQVLDGSYTGTPDGHSIFVRYPLSGIIAHLYDKKAEFHFLDFINEKDVNWYVTTVVIITTIAMIAVLFQMLCFFNRFRIAICVFFDMVFLLAWLPHFSNMTFSTAAAFMGCMSMLFFAFLRKENAHRLWNVLLLAFMLICAYCLRQQCFFMVLPIIAMEAIFKFNTSFFTSIRPYICIFLTGVIVFGAIAYDDSKYDTPQWEAYREYNSMRSHMQDYVGYPDYEENKKFYKSMGLSEAELYAMKHYTYSMVTNYTQDTLRKVYEYQHAEEETLPLKESMINAIPKAKEYFEDSDDCNPWLVKFGNYVWILAAVMMVISIIRFFWQFVDRAWTHLANLITLGGSFAIVAAEWTYLAVDARFPARVEESIRIFTLYAGVYALCRIMDNWSLRTRIEFFDPEFFYDPEDPEDEPATSPEYALDISIAFILGLILQIVITVFVWRGHAMTNQLDAVEAKQAMLMDAKSDKYEVISYCGEHPDNLYVLDTLSVAGGTRPTDDLHQGNWFMSGSWMNLSPIYYEKLAAHNTKELSYKFLARDNVYFITKGEKNVAKRMGYDDRHAVTVEIADKMTTTNNEEYTVYKIK